MNCESKLILSLTPLLQASGDCASVHGLSWVPCTSDLPSWEVIDASGVDPELFRTELRANSFLSLVKAHDRKILERPVGSIDAFD